MAASRYKLDYNATAHTTGAKTLVFENNPTYGQTVWTPPTGLAAATTFLGDQLLRGSLPIADYGNVNDVFLDVYFYKYAGSKIVMCNAAVEYWLWASESFSCTASGGVGKGDGSSYAGLAAGKTADGLVTDATWHRARFEYGSGSVAGALKLFIGANRHGTVPDATVALQNFFNAATYGWERISQTYFTGTESATVLSDAAYGVMSTDAIPARSATDWVVAAGPSFAGIIPI